MKVFQDIKYNIQQYHLFIIGLFIISYIIYVRLIVKRLPKDLNADVSLYFKLISLLLIISFTTMLFTNIRTYLIDFKYYKPITSTFLAEIKAFIIKKISILLLLWNNSLNHVHNKLVKAQIEGHIENLENYFIKINYSKIHYLAIIFNFFPKIVLLSTFLIDVFIFTQLNYFYKFSGFLLVPLIYNYIIFILQEDCLEGLQESNNYIIIINRENNSQISTEDYFCTRARHCVNNIPFILENYVFTFTDSFEQELKNTENVDYRATLLEFMTKFNLYIEVQIFILRLSTWQNLYSSLFHIVLYFFYGATWGYVLYLIY